MEPESPNFTPYFLANRCLSVRKLPKIYRCHGSFNMLNSRDWPTFLDDKEKTTVKHPHSQTPNCALIMLAERTNADLKLHRFIVQGGEQPRETLLRSDTPKRPPGRCDEWHVDFERQLPESGIVKKASLTYMHQ